MWTVYKGAFLIWFRNWNEEGVMLPLPHPAPRPPPTWLRQLHKCMQYNFTFYVSYFPWRSFIAILNLNYSWNFGKNFFLSQSTILEWSETVKTNKNVNWPIFEKCKKSTKYFKFKCHIALSYLFFMRKCKENLKNFNMLAKIYLVSLGKFTE